MASAEPRPWRERNLFFTQPEKLELSEWVNRNEVFTVMGFLLEPLYRSLQKLVPTTLAPNVLTLLGLLCVVNGFYLCVRFMEDYPLPVSIASSIFAAGYQIFNGIDGIHAKATANDSNLGHVFSRFCTFIGVVMQTMILISVLGISDLTLQWYIVQIVVLGLLGVNTRAFNAGILKYPLYFGEEELMALFECVLLARVTGLYDWLYQLFSTKVVPIVELYVSLAPAEFNGTVYEGEILLALRVVQILFLFTSLLCLIMVLQAKSATRNSLVAIYVLRMIVPAVLMYLNLLAEIDLFDVVSDGLFVSMVTADLLVSKMAKKDLHPWIVVFAFASLMSHALMFFMSVVYFFIVLFEIATYLNLPMFSMNVNVYIDGVYDMCHFGHFGYFERAAKQGTRLFVGVLSDEDVLSYKRLPVMRQEERIRQVLTSRYVFDVVRNPPLCVTDELIEKYKIHKVLCSVEYDSPDDRYYAAARKRNILVVMPRTPGISTSDLLRRIKARVTEEMRPVAENPPVVVEEEAEVEEEEEEEGTDGASENED